MPHALTPDQFYSEQLERLRREWELGDLRAVIEGFMLCTRNGRLLPQWLADAVGNVLITAFNEGGESKGGSGGHRAKAMRRDIHETRHAWAKIWLAAREQVPSDPEGSISTGSRTRADVFAFVQTLLAGTPAQGSARAIEESYNRVERRRKRSDG